MTRIISYLQDPDAKNVQKHQESLRKLVLSESSGKTFFNPFPTLNGTVKSQSNFIYRLSIVQVGMPAIYWRGYGFAVYSATSGTTIQQDY
jgi:hypothetical protein